MVFFDSQPSHFVDGSCHPWHKVFVNKGVCGFSEVLLSGTKAHGTPYPTHTNQENPQSPPQGKSNEALKFAQRGSAISLSRSTVISEICLDNLACDREVFLQECALICRFTKLWPKLSDLHAGILENWKFQLEDEICIFPCAKGFFILEFESLTDKYWVLKNGPWAL
ncbi:hypothetical protein SUGI_1164690 [Cryptomeria japonica]|nr:hypothetical protein SUGI_1164690 [Cryptomeria japonica]